MALTEKLRRENAFWVLRWALLLPERRAKKKKKIIFLSFLCFPVLFRLFLFFLKPWQKIGSQLWYPPRSARGWG